jgi:hypothetical protein
MVCVCMCVYCTADFTVNVMHRASDAAGTTSNMTTTRQMVYFSGNPKNFCYSNAVLPLPLKSLPNLGQRR